MSTAYERFAQYDRKHPAVWQKFEEIALGLIRAGRAYYSARDILPIIRWQTLTEQNDGCEFKINNNYSPYYARVFMNKHPQHAGFFRLRASHPERTL